VAPGRLPVPQATRHRPAPRRQTANQRDACSSYSGIKAANCVSKTGFSCSGYEHSARPDDCLSSAQLRARVATRKAQARAAARRRRQEAAAAVRRRRQEAAAAKAQAAAVAAANAWHQGYRQQDDNVYWKWVDGISCQEFASNGCWHVAVITQDGCSSYVAVNANEYQGQVDRQLVARQPRLRDPSADPARF